MFGRKRIKELEMENLRLREHLAMQTSIRLTGAQLLQWLDSLDEDERKMAEENDLAWGNR